MVRSLLCTGPVDDRLGPERQWRRSAVSWGEARPASEVPVRRYVRSSVAEFLGKKKSHFKLMIMGIR